MQEAPGQRPGDVGLPCNGHLRSQQRHAHCALRGRLSSSRGAHHDFRFRTPRARPWTPSRALDPEHGPGQTATGNSHAPSPSRPRNQIRAVPPDIAGHDPWTMYHNPDVNSLNEDEEIELQWRPDTNHPFGWWKGEHLAL